MIEKGINFCSNNNKSKKAGLRLSLATLALAGGMVACSSGIKEGDKGVAKENVSLVVNPLAPLSERDYCGINEGEKVERGRNSYVSDGKVSVGVTLIEGKNCSGWSYGGDYKNDFDWNK